MIATLAQAFPHAARLLGKLHITEIW